MIERLEGLVRLYKNVWDKNEKINSVFDQSNILKDELFSIKILIADVLDLTQWFGNDSTDIHMDSYTDLYIFDYLEEGKITPFAAAQALNSYYNEIEEGE